MRWKFGYVTLEITGYKPEKFVNIAARRGLFFRNVKYLEKQKIQGDISIKSFRKLRPVAVKARCRMHIIKRGGSAFFLDKCAARKPFFIAGVCSFAFLIWMTFLVGSIDINAPVTLSQQQILNFLENNGVHVGMFKFAVDDERLAKKIVLDLDGISWAEVSFKGMRLQVDVAEAVPKPDIVPYTEPCNMIAAKEGVIHSMNVKNGMATVKIGDTVTAGDLLVSGNMNHKYEEGKTFPVHAHGEIYATTWYKAEQIVDTMEIDRNRTGKSYRHSYLEIMGIKIGLPERKNPYAAYDTRSERKKVVLWGSIRLPIVVNQETFYECEEMPVELDGEQALAKAKETAYAKAVEQIPEGTEIANAEFSYKPTQNDGICVEVIVECIENIAVQAPMG